MTRAFTWEADATYESANDPDTRLGEWHLFGQSANGGCAGCVYETPDGLFTGAVGPAFLVTAYHTPEAAMAAVETELRKQDGE